MCKIHITSFCILQSHVRNTAKTQRLKRKRVHQSLTIASKTSVTFKWIHEQQHCSMAEVYLNSLVLQIMNAYKEKT